jgi:uncharacterized cupin superfamily protein
MAAKISEAPLRQGEAGLVPAGEGWFIVNVADAEGMRTEQFGDACRFESRSDGPRFPEFGINVRVLMPGRPNCMYHRENGQEAMLVLGGECIAIVEDTERPMRTGDFLHLPPWTAHVCVGAGDGPCAVLMVGTRKTPDEVVYPVSEVAAKYGASVERETDDAAVAYAGFTPPEPATIGLPW